jgi:hypothetical protein
MRTLSSVFVFEAAASVAVLLAGCVAHGTSVTNTQHPGPAIGHAVGSAVGVVGGNAAGLAVGVGEGVAAGAKAPFDRTTRVVRRWRTETTADGRTIQVPEDVLVDAQGRVIGPAAAAKKGK